MRGGDRFKSYSSQCNNAKNKKKQSKNNQKENEKILWYDHDYNANF